MTHYKNVFACLVHEKPECIVDLVRNLRYFSPESAIILYNGSAFPHLLDTFPFEKMGVYICPNPQPMKWGWLHEYALQSMKFAASFCTFEAFTIVDSDQLCVQSGYATLISNFLQKNPQVGILTNAPQRQMPPQMTDPATQMYKEKDVWLSLLATLPTGAESFMYWGFWPSTVFSYAACQALTQLFDTNSTLQQLLKTTKIWASEEVLFPTLVKALGYNIAQNPCSYDYVQYKKNYTAHEVKNALHQSNVYWIHPIPRNIQHDLRKLIAQESNNYVYKGVAQTETSTWVHTIIQKTAAIEGWLSFQEARALALITEEVCKTEKAPIIVEIGSYCGKSTCVMGLALQYQGSQGKVYAIDPFEGVVGAEDHKIEKTMPTYDKFLHYIKTLSIQTYIEPIKAKSENVKWGSHINFLFIDGLHDYFNVARDFWLFEHAVIAGGYIAFHDYADYYAGVKGLVDEAIASQIYTQVSLSDSLIVLKKKPNSTLKKPIVQTLQLQQV